MTINDNMSAREVKRLGEIAFRTAYYKAVADYEAYTGQDWPIPNWGQYAEPYFEDGKWHSLKPAK